jgi:hypothetical protein
MNSVVFLFLMSCGEREDTSVEQQDVPTFTELENDVFGMSCAFSSCHGSGTAGLLLNGEDDFERLINVDSTVLAGEILVIPGDSSNSYLIKKMRGTEGIVGDIMPSGGMDENVIQRIEDWIDAGALQD